MMVDWFYELFSDEEMSTRWYPIYQRGNPQLRIFLPNFWMKLVQLEKISAPSNKVLHNTCVS
jgi:hypothetical protein